ncbi:TPA: restriction endonuclease subunit S, partial [Pasteurella multocida]|nr:restriction endonuclease subunit S [Pasteurella multocida]HDR1648363.1 restriction endonuclease subunit S [Pasteurella multocida]
MSSWKIVKLVEIVDVISEKIDVQSLNPSKYISTENMLPNKCGIEISSSLPNVTKVNKFCNSDTLFSNIRTYFKKVWQAEFSGGASPDVLIFRTKD